MKKTVLFFLQMAAFGLTAQTCASEGITFYNQAAINNFTSNYPGCTQILGNVIIYGLPATANLNGLSEVSTIGGNLSISYTDIPSLMGFNALTSVGGNITIENNALSDLNGLNALTAIGGGIDIRFNTGLTSLTGINALKSLGGNLGISTNIILSDLTALSGLTSIGGGLDINYNDALSNLSGLHRVAAIGGNLNIYFNKGLSDLTGLDSLTTVEKGITIARNAALASLTGLDALSAIGGDLTIANNKTLKNLAGLEALTTIGGKLSIFSNPDLENLIALNALTAIAGKLTVSYNDTLMSLAGLDYINPATITDLSIEYSGHLTNCHVQSICNYLANPANPAKIIYNFPSCYNREQVELACAGFPVISATTDLLAGKFSVFPNPTTGIIEISSTENLTATVRLTDSFGRLLHTARYPDTLPLDISGLPNGVYYLELETDRASAVKRIVKH